MQGPYAKRYQAWPPEGFSEPTREELAAVLRKTHRFRYDNVDTKDLSRWLQVMAWFGSACSPADSRKIYDFMHTVRRELSGRKVYPGLLGILRCGVCSHASERLWEATGETHNIRDRNDEPVTSIFVCTRCWSDSLNDEE